MTTDLLPFLTNLAASPCAKTFIPDMDRSENANELCARLLARAFREGALGVKDCISSASVLQPSCGWPTQPPQLLLADRRLPLLQRIEEQQVFLNIGRKMIEVEDLRHPRLGDVGEPSHGGQVGHRAGFEQVLAMNGQGHEAADAGHALGLGLRLGRLGMLAAAHLDVVATMAVADLGDVKGAFDTDCHG